MHLRRVLLAALALALITCAVYWPVCRFPFINYDDPDYITRNGVVQGGVSLQGLGWAFGALHGQATYWHPLTWISHMLDCQLFGLNAGAHHLTNLLLHIANVLLLFICLERMTGRIWASALVAAFFALHPLQVESVAWVSERKNLLSTLFLLLTVWAYLRFSERPTLARYGAVGLFFAMNLTAKPILVTFPFALLLLDVWPLRRLRLSDDPAQSQAEAASRFPARPMVQLLLEKAPLFLLALAAGIVAVAAHEGLGMVGFDYGLTSMLRFENALVSYWRYVAKLFWPSDLCAIYPHPGRWPPSMAAGSAVFVVLVTGWVVGELRRHPYLLVGWLWFLSLLLPTIGLIQVGSQAMADRFVYVPMVGLLIMLVWGFADLLREEKWRQLIGAVLGLATLAGCGLASRWQLQSWRDSVALYQRAIAVTENNFFAYNNLGQTFADQGQIERAIGYLSEAVRIRPDQLEVRYRLGKVLDQAQQPQLALGQYRDLVRLDPNWPLPRLELAKVLIRLGQENEASNQLSVVTGLWPENGEAKGLTAMLLAGRGRRAEAIDGYREALRLSPAWPEALNNLAWLLATSPQTEQRNGPEAVRLAEHACALTRYEKAIFIGTLAAAYAEAGRFGEATNAAQKASAVATANGETEVATTNLKLLDLYRQGKAYHQELP